MCIYTRMYIHTYTHICLSVCALQVSVHTFPFFATEEELAVEYNLITLLGTLHSYERKQVTLYSSSKLKYSCALVFSNILSRESPMRRDECIGKKKDLSPAFNIPGGIQRPNPEGLS